MGNYKCGVGEGYCKVLYSNMCEKVVIGAYLPVVCTVQPLDNSNIKDNVKNYVKNNHSCCIGEWDVTRVTDMNSLFYYDGDDKVIEQQFASFNQDLGSWNVERVTSMAGMFEGAESFNQNLGSWNVTKVTDMGMMFQRAYSFNQNLGSWNVAKVTDMGMMFYGATSFNQTLCWDLSHITDNN